jgi:hypothetical protein
MRIPVGNGRTRVKNYRNEAPFNSSKSALLTKRSTIPRSATLLYLAGWRFERYAVNREPSAAEIDAGLRGDV